MTLIIGFGNSQQFVMSGDRRFTNWDGSGFTDENVKVASFTCSNSRLAVAFAGLARSPAFETATWILETLSELAKPDYEAEKTLERFCDRASRDFSRLRIDKRYLRTTFLFGGFHGVNPPLPCFARISNYEHGNGITSDIATEKFSSFKLIQTRFSGKEPTLMVTAGNPSGLDITRFMELKSMLEEKKPVNAVVQKAVAIIQDAADNFRSGGSVGKQISTVIVPSDPGQPVRSAYDTAVPTTRVFSANGVIALPGTEIAFRDGTIERAPDGTNSAHPILVSRNSPCVCGSGKRYKRCCGNLPSS